MSTNKEHCCPYCGSDDIRILASPDVRVILDDKGHCKEIVDDWPTIYNRIDECGPEDFYARCEKCGQTCNIVFEEGAPEGGTEWRLERKTGMYPDYTMKYRLLYNYLT